MRISLPNNTFTGMEQSKIHTYIRIYALKVYAKQDRRTVGNKADRRATINLDVFRRKDNFNLIMHDGFIYKI